MGKSSIDLRHFGEPDWRLRRATERSGVENLLRFYWQNGCYEVKIDWTAPFYHWFGLWYWPYEGQDRRAWRTLGYCGILRVERGGCETVYGDQRKRKHAVDILDGVWRIRIGPWRKRSSKLNPQPYRSFHKNSVHQADGGRGWEIS